jgi:hypothetical protein
MLMELRLHLMVGVWWVRSCRVHTYRGGLYNTRTYTNYDSYYFIRSYQMLEIIFGTLASHGLNPKRDITCASLSEVSTHRVYSD